MADILADWERRVLRSAMEIFKLECVDPNSILDPKSPQNFLELQSYVNENYHRAELDGMLSITEDALVKVSQNLADAHEQAAKVVESAPTAAEVKKLMDLLGDVDQDIQKDQKFHVALQLSLGLQTVLKNRLNSF